MFFFFNDTATTEIYTLSLHDALPHRSTGRAPARPTLSGTRREMPKLLLPAVGIRSASSSRDHPWGAQDRVADYHRQHIRGGSAPRLAKPQGGLPLHHHAGHLHAH